MKKKRRVEITVENRTLVLRRPLNEAVVFCPHCASPTIAPEQAAALASVSARAIYRGVEREQLHFVEANDTQLLICLNSLGLTQKLPQVSDELQFVVGFSQRLVPVTARQTEVCLTFCVSPTHY